jgi:hypothetical protein
MSFFTNRKKDPTTYLTYLLMVKVVDCPATLIAGMVIKPSASAFPSPLVSP